MQLHVSAGIGTSPFAPMRFFCRPEATLLTLVPARTSGHGADAESGDRSPSATVQ